MNTQEQYNEAYRKIMDWVYTNAPDNLDHRIEIEFPHDMYNHRVLRVRPNRGASILVGDWGWGFDYEFELYTIWRLSKDGKPYERIVDNPNIFNIRNECVRLLVDSWRTCMKLKVQSAFEKYTDLNSFEA